MQYLLLIFHFIWFLYKSIKFIVLVKSNYTLKAKSLYRALALLKLILRPKKKLNK